MATRHAATVDDLFKLEHAVVTSLFQSQLSEPDREDPIRFSDAAIPASSRVAATVRLKAVETLFNKPRSGCLISGIEFISPYPTSAEIFLLRWGIKLVWSS
jgi:hypothetical protein